jgi:hypothetical protein
MEKTWKTALEMAQEKDAETKTQRAQTEIIMLILFF